MAYTVKADGLTPTYHVDFSVGAKAVNRRDDVMLVQWMLHRIYKGYGRPPVGGKPMAIDGWIGPQTSNWIWDFQRRVRGSGRKCAVDGRVDQALKFYGSVSKTIYTILWMNRYLQAVCPDFAANPASDPDCPIILRNALAQNTIEASPEEVAAGATAGI